MQSTVPLPSPADRHPKLAYDHQPGLGDFIYSSTTRGWTHRRQKSDGSPLLLLGSGRVPSDAQIRLWNEIDARLDELTATAATAVREPPVRPRRAMFDPADLEMDQVEVTDDGTFYFYFATPAGDEIDLWPMVTFKESIVTKSDWVP